MYIFVKLVYGHNRPDLPMKTTDSTVHSNWIILPPGKTAILRFPFQGELKDLTLPSGLSNPRLATPCELIVVNLGRPYPWGYSPEAFPEKTSKMWKEGQMGIGGLIFDAWFVTAEGRFGGAPNVPKTGPGALRHFMYLDGGLEPTGLLAENEGYAVVCDVADSHDAYRKIQVHAAEHVVADTGAIIVSPKDDDGAFHVGFVGRCMTCPNPELFSLRALRNACPDLSIELHPDWKGWTL